MSTEANIKLPTCPAIAGARPDWIRLPKPGMLCPWTGLSRSKLWEVLQIGSVRHIVLLKPGAKRGARLIKLESLLAYFDSLPSQKLTLNADEEDEA